MQTVICDRCGKKLFSKKPIGSFRGEYYAPRGFRGNVWIDRFLGYKIVDVDIDLLKIARRSSQNGFILIIIIRETLKYFHEHVYEKGVMDIDICEDCADELVKLIRTWMKNKNN